MDFNFFDDEALDHVERQLADASAQARSEPVDVPPFEPDQHRPLSCAAREALRALCGP